MTKKDYVLIANAVAEYYRAYEKFKKEMPRLPMPVIEQYLAIEFQKQNPHFNSDLFINACQYGLPNLLA